MNNNESLKAFFKALENSSHSIGCGIARERFLTHCYNDLGSFYNNSEDWQMACNMFGRGSFLRYFKDLLSTCEFDEEKRAKFQAMELADFDEWCKGEFIGKGATNG